MASSGERRNTESPGKPGSIALALLALLAIAAAAYLPAVANGGFVWDDDAYVTRNLALRDGAGLVRIWTDVAATPQYYPLTFTSFWLEYRFWGTEPLGYHATNVVLHGCAAILAFLVLRSLGVPGAWLAAALFAVHPVHVESVAWITERKNVLSGTLYLASLLVWVRYFRLDREKGDGCDSPPWLAFAGGLLFAGALLSKTVVSTLPVTLALLIWWKRGRVKIAHAAWLGAMLLGGALMGALTALLEKQQVGAIGEEWSLGLLERAVVAGRAWWFYLGKLALPIDLTFIYPRWDVPASMPAGLVWPLLTVAALAALCFTRARWGDGPLVALLHYTAALSPALGFFDVYPMRFSFVADHFQYLASLGPLALASAACARLLRERKQLVLAGTIAGALLLLLLGGLTWQRGRVFRDRETLWEDTLAKNPAAWIAHNNLGAIKLERGQLSEAATHFGHVAELKPDHAPSRTNLAVLLLREGAVMARTDPERAESRFAEAELLLEEALDIDPEEANTHANLGDVLTARGNLAGAEESYTAALRRDPAHAHANAGLGRIRLRQQRYEDARRHLEASLQVAPDEPMVLYNLATTLVRLGEDDQALERYARLLDLQPENVDALYNRGTVLARMGRLREAERLLAEAVRLRPDHERAQRNLALTRQLLAER